MLPTEKRLNNKAFNYSRYYDMLNLKQWYWKNQLLIWTLLGVLSGTTCGIVLRKFDQLTEVGVSLISYPGEMFMRILKLIILPLIISSLVSCSASLNMKLNGKITARTFTYFVLTSLFNSVLGITLAMIIKPGYNHYQGRIDGLINEIKNNNSLEDHHHNSLPVVDSFFDVGRNIIPDNIFRALFQQTQTVYVWRNTTRLKVLSIREGTNNLGVIVFCLVFGSVLGTLNTSSSKVVIEFFRAIYEVVMKVMAGVMWLTPLGITSIICGKIVSVEDIELVFSQLGWFILTILIGVLLYQLVFMQMIYLLILRRNPYRFYWGLTPAILTAFATASAAAALPVTFKCLDENAKIDKRISRYILPIGCSINMDGTALFLSAAAVFICQINQLPLDLGTLTILCLVSTAASMSSASVPSAALVLMLMVLSSIGCPTDDVSILFAVDWLVDRIRTTNNMLGDCYASAVVEFLSQDELKNTLINTS